MSSANPNIVRVVAYNHLYKVAHHPEKVRGLQPDVLLSQELAGVNGLDRETMAATITGDPDMDVFYVKHRLVGGGGSAIFSRLAMKDTIEHTLLQSRFTRLTQNPALA